MMGRLLRHVSHYSVGTLLVTLAGFVSFPIFTRVFSVEEYGLMGLISTSLVLLVGVGKLGVQQSIVRFHSEVKSGKRDASEAQFNSTVVFGMASVGAIVTLAWAGISQAVPDHWWNDARVPGLMLLTAVLVLVRVFESSFVNLLRAQQRSFAFSIYQVLKRYSSLGLVLAAVFIWWGGLRGFFLGTIVAEVLAVALLAWTLFRGAGLAARRFSPPLFKAMLVFGLPMIGYEIAGGVLSFGDRYVIQALLGAQSLGAYSAAYNLCEYVQALVIASVIQAIVPMYTRAWDEHGQPKTQAFLEQALHFYAILGVGLVLAMACGGEGVLTLMASAKYHDGAVVIPWVMAGMVLDGAAMLVGAGLFLHKRTNTIMWAVAACAVLNLGLNYLLIPVMGITGSALATLLAYAGFFGVSMALGRRDLPIGVAWLQIAKIALIGAVAWFAAMQVSLDGGLDELLCRLAAAALLYVGVLMLLDRQVRDAARSLVSKLRGTNGVSKEVSP